MARKRKSSTVDTVCKNHPEKKTRRRCYQCKEYICTSCIIRYDHHFFCSHECIREYENSPKQSKKPSSKSVKRGESSEKKKKKKIISISLSDIIFIIFIFLLSIFLYFQWQEYGGLSSETEVLLSDTQIDTTWKPVIYGSQLEFSIEGDFPESRVLTVWINNVFYKTIHSAGKLKIPLTIMVPGENAIRISAVGPDTMYVVYETSFLLSRPDLKRLDYTRIPGQQRWIALTFDAGSNDGALDSIIAILNKYDVRATAFLTGIFMQNFPEKVLQLIESRRFDFGNHSFSHPHLTTYAQNRRHETLENVHFEFFKNELLKTDSLFYSLSGFHMYPIWRAPYGEYNTEILQWAGLLGYVHIGWSPGFDTFDWVKDTTSKIYYTPEELWKKWKKRYEESPNRYRGAIILMHLGNERVKPMYSFLHQFIPYMKSHGYSFVTIPQVLQNGQLTRSNLKAK